MPKMVRTARGELVDWDLMRVQSQQQNNVAEKVEITAQPQTPVARKEQRAKMEAAKKLLEQAKREQMRIQQIATLPSAEAELDPEWDTVEPIEPPSTQSNKSKKK